MAYEAYEAANKQAQKAYRAAMNRGDYPYLPALDDFLPYEKTAGEKYIGLVEIPLDLVVGTKTAGRQNSFANNFMPLLGGETEFAYKWSDLHEAQLQEGIRDPIVAYEYMHRFYVMEGNKRVSVLKSLKAAKISAKVTRIIPKKTDDLETKIYYEFMDFYEDFDEARAYDMLKKLQISADEHLKTLSKGTKEKVQLILVMSRRAKLYILDEPIAGVDPAARDYILNTIITNYEPEASILLATHLIADIENVLDEVVFIKDGQIIRHSSVDDIRIKEGSSVDAYFREVFKC